jgi:hypothetical protein
MADPVNGGFLTEHKRALQRFPTVTSRHATKGQGVKW